MSWETEHEWSDIQPHSQDDKDGVCVIAYEPSFVKAMDYFRAVVALEEKSERVLALLGELLEHNPANYSVWHHRRLVLAHLAHKQSGSSGAAEALYLRELAYLDRKISETPKNYQVWYHRQVIVSLISPPPPPPPPPLPSAPAPSHDPAILGLALTSEVLLEDAKNYHAWAYRQWVVATYQLWEQEKAFVERLIAADIRNNSAWNQRFFVLSRASPSLLPSLLPEELSFTLGKIKMSPSNESSWNYLRGITEENFASFPEIKALCLDLHAQNIPSPHLLSALADIYHQENNLEEAKRLLTLLETKVDTIHGKFWALKKSQLNA